jgi:multidrug efflux system membrane fusion protein
MKRRFEVSSRRASLLGGAVAFLLAACNGPVERNANAKPADVRPRVTVAEPVRASIVEVSEHTGRTEAPSAVEIRARSAGYLQQAAFKEGDLIKKGDLLFVVDPRPYRAALARAQAELQSAHVDQGLAGREAERAAQLFRAGVTTEQERDLREATLNQLAARASVAAAVLATAQLDLDYAFVRSPIAGRVGRIQVTPGNLVGPTLATPLTTVVSVDPLYVYMDVDEARALRLKRGAGAAARVGFPDEAGYPHEAAVDFVDNRVDPQTGTLKVRAVIRNPDGRWMHGLFARVQLPEEGAHDAILIADQAVATDQDRKFVWVVGQNGKVQPRPVKLGQLDHGLRVVRDGLSSSDRVIVRGLQRVRPSVEVATELVAMRDVTFAEGNRP